MRTSRPCGKRCVEVHIKTRVQLQVVFEHLDHVNVMVAFKVDLREIVVIEEVIGNDQALIVVGEHDIVRASVHAQVDDSCLERMLGVGYVEHPDLPSLERSEDQGSPLCGMASNWVMPPRTGT